MPGNDKETTRLTIAKVKEIVLQSMTEQGRSKKVFYLNEEVQPKGKELVIGDNKYDLNADTIVVFIDNEPGANWGHDCTYLFFNIHTGEVKEIKEQFPPSLRNVPGTFRLIWKPEGIPSWTLWSEK